MYLQKVINFFQFCYTSFALSPLGEKERVIHYSKVFENLVLKLLISDIIPRLSYMKHQKKEWVDLVKIFFPRITVANNPLIARPLQRSLNCAYRAVSVLDPTINVAQVPQQQQVQLLTPFVMTQFGQSFEPITFPTTS